MNKSIFLMIIFFIMSTTLGCVPRSLKPGAQNITILYDHTISVLKSCTFLGKISGKDVHGTKIQFTWGLEKNLAKDDINFLKNEGKKLNANVVVFEKHQNLVKRYQLWSPSRHTDISNHTIEGSAYRCPSQIMSSIKQFDILKDSVYEKPIVIKGN